MAKITVSLIKADVGSVAGHSLVPQEIISLAEGCLKEAVESKLIIDFRVFNAGDDLELLITHRKGVDSEEIHGLAWNTFVKAANKAKEMKLYGAGQDLLKDAFSGNVRGLGPGVAEIEFTERRSEPLVVFMMDKTEPGAFNFPIFKIFADPFNTAGLVIDPAMHSGFIFEIWDIKEHRRVFMASPEEMYDILALIGSKGRFVIKRVYPKKGGKLPADEPVAVVSTEKLYEVAGEYVGKDDPVAILRAQAGLPAVGEILEAFSFPHLVSGWMRGSHNGPVLPVPFRYSKCTRFDGPPRCIAAGFQLCDGKLIGPVDLFDDPAFEYTRMKAMEITEYMRRHGPFEPHRLPHEEMEYTTLPKVLVKLKDRFEKI
ncbi:MAG: fructose-1,6-bisphosphatase [Archaeoglobaceae archaeon]|nr:fructose-1,6-bisphosphatase [Archaeoglobaceae archaeon]MCX8152065.1 fructose-1,6-bisphosphate aldolase/phosphatase [Archaeoglobaceae archaeon]MDW8013830.1 fructose-1,6-bisphosphate aldolase/phosphatase [Archaeoglobaceae archaeon]